MGGGGGGCGGGGGGRVEVFVYMCVFMHACMLVYMQPCIHAPHPSSHRQSFTVLASTSIKVPTKLFSLYYSFSFM